jgi:hypothetical protein
MPHFCIKSPQEFVKKFANLKMGKSSRITRIGISKQKKEQLKIKKQIQVKPVKKTLKVPVEIPETKKKYVTDGMTDYLKLMGM